MHRAKAKELEDLKKSYKESIDELETLRTKVCHPEWCLCSTSEPSNLRLTRMFDSLVKVSRGRAAAVGGWADQIQGDHKPAEGWDWPAERKTGRGHCAPRAAWTVKMHKFLSIQLEQTHTTKMSPVWKSLDNLIVVGKCLIKFYFSFHFFQ